MLKLDREQRGLLADKVGDVANLIFAALVVGQALSGQAFSSIGAAAGIVAWAVCLAGAIRVRRGHP